MRFPPPSPAPHYLRLGGRTILFFAATCGCEQAEIGLSEQASNQLQPPVLDDAGRNPVADASPPRSDAFSEVAPPDAALLRGLEAACAAGCGPSAALPCADPNCAKTCTTSLSGACQGPAIDFLQCLARRLESEFTCDGDGRRVSPKACKRLEAELINCLRAE